jgi:hypothetical protein
VTQTVFTLPYKVSVAAGQSLMLPILDRELPAQRIDLYQSSADQHHPLAAIALANDGETGLPPGVLTIYEQGTTGGATYLGDARLAAFPPGEGRRGCAHCRADHLQPLAPFVSALIDRLSDQRFPRYRLRGR